MLVGQAVYFNCVHRALARAAMCVGERETKVKRGRERERVRAGGQESDRARAPRVGSGRWGGEVAGSGVVNVEGRGGWQSDSCVLFFAMNSLRASHHGQQKQQK